MFPVAPVGFTKLSKVVNLFKATACALAATYLSFDLYASWINLATTLCLGAKETLYSKIFWTLKLNLLSADDVNDPVGYPSPWIGDW